MTLAFLGPLGAAEVVILALVVAVVVYLVLRLSGTRDRRK